MKIFISYSHNNSDIASKFQSRLTEYGFDVHWDKELHIGASVGSLQDIMLDCDAVLVILSTSSFTSRFVQAEMMMALGYGKVSGKPVVIPYVMHGIETPLQYPADTIQHFVGTKDLEGDIDRIIQELNTIKGATLAIHEKSKEQIENIRKNLDMYINTNIRLKYCNRF